MKQFFLITFVCLALSTAAQTADTTAPSRWLLKKPNFRFQTTAMVQAWTIYSTQFERYNSQSAAYEAVDDRMNVSLRRARLVFNGEPYERLRYNVALYYDQAGRDLLSSGIGVTNKADPAVGIWDAFLEWRVFPKSQALNVVAGWFRPQIQRESITSGWTVNSFEKAGSQTYVRKHLVGTGPGRAAGINIGGLVQQDRFGLQYSLGLFNPVTAAFGATSSGVRYAPLLTARAVFSIGQPEQKQYGISYSINKLGERKGLSIDLNAARQGHTDLFTASQLLGPGLLFNWGPVTIDGEWMWMQRSGQRTLSDGQVRRFDYQSGAGHARVGYTFFMRRFALEPLAMATWFEGAHDALGQADAKAVGESSGSEQAYDLGLNWYLNAHQLKLMLHYTFRNGQSGDAGKGADVNDYFYQNGIGPIHRGNWLGLGLNAIF